MVRKDFTGFKNYWTWSNDTDLTDGLGKREKMKSLHGRGIYYVNLTASYRFT